jgi:hypothetical protein
MSVLHRSKSKSRCKSTGPLHPLTRLPKRQLIELILKYDHLAERMLVDLQTLTWCLTHRELGWQAAQASHANCDKSATGSSVHGRP